MKDNVRIIQSSPAHTGSTVLANLLYGMFAPREPVSFSMTADSIGKEEKNSESRILKTHNIDFDYWSDELSCSDLFFMITHRANHKQIDVKYQAWPNVLIFDYDEINETDGNSLWEIVDNAFDKIFNLMEGSIEPRLSTEEVRWNMMDRIVCMNQRYDEIKDRPFSYYDEFYHIHGSHRGRGSGELQGSFLRTLFRFGA